jgi:hypothetical protein
MNKHLTTLFTAAAISAFILALGQAPAEAAEASQQKTTQVTRSNISNNRAAEVDAENAAAPNQNPSRTNHLSAGGGAASASYAATGRASAAGGDDIVEPDEAAAGVKSPRDAASGQATGKRQHKPVRVATGDVDGDGAAETGVVTSREAGSGMSTGRRQHEPIRSATADTDGDAAAAATQDHNSSRSNKSASVAPDGGATTGASSAPRDAASGQATGKRQHKPLSVNPDLDSDNDGISDADAQGMAINEKGMPGNYKAKQGKTGSAK